MAAPLQKQFGHPRFYELLEEIAQLHSDKNADYSSEEDPLSNLRACEDIGIPAWKGVITRLMDKWKRIINLARGQEAKVKSESIADTLKDNAVYSLLAIVLYEESEKERKNGEDA